MNGPLGACHGGDNGSALLVSVSQSTFPAAHAVNNGARRGLRLLSRAGHPRETFGDDVVVRVARFATRMWRTINGERADPPILLAQGSAGFNGVCAYDGPLRCTLLALWQWIWPRGCFAVLQVQAWRANELTSKQVELVANHVMNSSEIEKTAVAQEENLLSDLNRLVAMEIDRQVWRGEMVRKAYEFHKAKGSGTNADIVSIEQPVGPPLPPIQRDAAFKQGGWIASSAQQRRALALDGGTAVTKLRLNMKSFNDS
jgi:hypothetical protein